MSQPEDNSGPAFPMHSPESGTQNGMTLRQYAAIKLKVPESGTDWLDELITESLRDDLAAKAMQGMLSDLPKTLYGLQWQSNLSESSYELADIMLEARK